MEDYQIKTMPTKCAFDLQKSFPQTSDRLEQRRDKRQKLLRWRNFNLLLHQFRKFRFGSFSGAFRLHQTLKMLHEVWDKVISQPFEV